MENQVLAIHQSYEVSIQGFSRRPGGVKRSRNLSSVHSISKQARHFKWENKVALRPPRTSLGLGVRAKKSGLGFQLPGTLKAKKSEEATSDDNAGSVTGTNQFRQVPGTWKFPGRERSRPKDKNVIFVAGATGKVGRRVVRELVRLGFRVRAGVRNLETAQFLLEFAEEADGRPAAQEKKLENKGPSLWASFVPSILFGSSPKKPGVELVEVDLSEDPSEIEAALGSASVVVCAIGASEKEVLKVTGPYEVDFKATDNLIKAAMRAKVNHFLLLTSLGTNKIGWPALTLNLFWGVLIWKAKAEKALMESGIPFTIVRPGGMEKPTDAYKETHNLRLDKADSRFGGQVSRLQVAELIGCIVSNLGLAQDKVLEVVAEKTAPLRSIEDLLAEIPSIAATNAVKEASNATAMEMKSEEEKIKMARREELQSAKRRAEEEKLARREELKAAKKRDEEERAAEKAKAEALRETLQREYVEAKEREKAAQRDAAAARLNKEDIERRVSELRTKAGAAGQAARVSKALEVAIIAASREGKTLSDQEKKEIVASIRQEIASEAKQKEAEEKAIQQEKAAKEAEQAEARKAEEAKAQEAEIRAKVEEQKKSKVEAEMKAKAEAEKKLKIEAEIKVKAEAEEKAKLEAEVKAKAEAEEKAKVEAEMKAKAEAEEKAKVEAEMRAKEAEENAKVEAETKAKKEAEEKAQLQEAEIKAKKEAEEKAKEEAEIRAKNEAEERAKVEAEKKAKDDADKKAKDELEIRAKAEAEEKAKAEDALIRAKLGDKRKEKKEKAVSKPFLWPWQKDWEDDGKAVENKSTEFPPSPKPLSPYTKYPGLRPPSSPTPLAPGTNLSAKGVTENGYVDLSPPSLQPPASDVAAPAEDTKFVATKTALEVTAREQNAAETAKSANSAKFFWPWQRKEESPPSTVTKTETPSSSTDLPRSSRPLSPYWRYPDLKPPTSPTPSVPAPARVPSSATELSREVVKELQETPSKNGFRWPW